MPQTVHMALEWVGVLAIVAIGLEGAHAVVRKKIQRISDTEKNAMAAKHVLQAITEFKQNHPEIAALYHKATGE
jgi:hypothetical protein